MKNIFNLVTDLWKLIDEAKEILRFAHEKLSNMTTDEFSKGDDKEIRQKIAKFLDIKEIDER